MIQRLAVIGWLALVWIGLEGGLVGADLTRVAAAVAVAVGVVVAFPLGPAGPARVSPVRVVRYLGWLAVQMVVATARVVVAVLAPRGRVDPGTVTVALRARSELVVAVVANSVTLTPGTLTVDVISPAGSDPANPTGSADWCLVIHALNRSDPDAVRSSVTAFEARAVAAVGSREDRATWAAGAGGVTP